MKLDLRRSVHLYFTIRHFPHHAAYYLLFFLLLITIKNAKAQDTTAFVRNYHKTSDPFAKATSSQKLGHYYYEKENYEPGIRWAQQGLPYALQTKVDTVIWNHYDLLANLHDNAIHFDTSIHYMLLSLALKKKANNLRKMAGTYNDLGVVYGEKTELVKQADYYYKAKRIYDQIGDTTEGTLVAANLANNLVKQNKYREAIDAYNAMMPRLKQRNFWGLHFICCGNMATSFAALHQSDSSFYYTLQQINRARALNDTVWQAEAWGRRANLCGNLNNLKDFNQALDSAYFYGKLSGEYFNWGDYHQSMGMYATLVDKQYDAAIDHYYQSLAYRKKFSDKAATLGVLSKIAETYQLAGDADSAYKILLQAYTLKDSIITDDGRAKLAEMQTKYDTEKKEAQIQLLDKDNKLKQRTTYFLIGGLGLLAVLLVTLIRNNRLKQKINKKLQVLNAALDEANQSKVRLFSILSHDLRSPVSSLYSYLQLKKIAPQMLSEEKRQEKEEQLQQSAGHLLETMEDVLLWSKSQLENFAAEKKEVSAMKVVENVLNIYRSYIDAEGIVLKLPVEDLTLFTDENILQTILRNIISNAVKHTPNKGSIIVGFEKSPTSIAVYNSGKHIDETTAKSIFTWSNISSGNHGYGLKMSKALADKLGIVLSLERKKDGNKFVLEM